MQDNQSEDTGPPKLVPQPSSAASSGTVSVPRIRTGGETPPQPAVEDDCTTSKPDSKPNTLVSGFHFRGVLPHLKREGATYFVTFRLAGTLPREVLMRFKAERNSILQHAVAAKRPLTWGEQEDLFRWYSERVDSYLDCGRGECYLRRPDCAGLTASALTFFEGERYELRSWAVMPNHVHVVVWPKPPNTLSKILHSWKSYTAHEINKLLPNKVVPLWQNESYDHLVRDDEDFNRCISYTRMNPVKARLCAEAHEWPWSSSYLAQPSSAASSGTVSVPRSQTGGEAPP